MARLAGEAANELRFVDNQVALQNRVRHAPHEAYLEGPAPFVRILDRVAQFLSERPLNRCGVADTRNRCLYDLTVTRRRIVDHLMRNPKRAEREQFPGVCSFEAY